jgi:hypothetical protein
MSDKFSKSGCKDNFLNPNNQPFAKIFYIDLTQLIENELLYGQSFFITPAESKVLVQWTKLKTFAGWTTILRLSWVLFTLLLLVTDRPI